MNQELLVADLIKRAKLSGDRELCAFVVSDNRGFMIIDVENIAPNPKKDFQISIGTYTKVFHKFRILAFFHTHFRKPKFSDHDEMTSEAFCLPFFMTCKETETFHQYIPRIVKVPLDHRPYFRGLYDCVGLCRDYFWQEHQLALNDAGCDRDIETELSSDDQPKLLQDKLVANGFVEIEEPNQKSDIAVTKGLLLGRKCAHLYIYSGKNTWYHHAVNRVSEITKSINWRKRVIAYYRHESLVK